MGSWSANSKTHVSTMQTGDFYANEKSMTLKKADTLTIQHLNANGKITILKENLAVLPGEIIDATLLSKKALLQFLQEQIKDAKEKNVLFSIHLKATMMKVSDPIIFGHAVKVFFKEVFTKHQETFQKIGIDANNGFNDLLNKITSLPEKNRIEIENDIATAYKNGPDLAMVDSTKGITNLHVPSDVIIDASMPAMIRNSGKMWDAKGEARDIKAVIPDSSYACIYQASIDFCKAHGAFNPTTMGTVSNVGLMAQQAEEYGSHDKTFEIKENGKVQVVNSNGTVWMEQAVESGDIWRMCQAKDAPIQDWVKLAVKRAKATGEPTIFWLDNKRAHDIEIIKKVNTYLKEYDTSGLDIQIMNPLDATSYSLKRVKEGKNTISVTGNILRDYLTDLFPILEVGTSAKMLSIVPLMNGGGMFETGAGGSAPKHVDQFLKENHLRWDSLGEFLALTVSLEHLGNTTNNAKAIILAETLDEAIESFLENDKSPSRKVGELDNRGSHFYLAMYWAEALAKQNKDETLKTMFTKVAKQLKDNEATILDELIKIQGKPVELKGYYSPDVQLITQAMRPSKTFNTLLKSIA